MENDIPTSTVRVIAPAEIASGIISIGVGITEADDFHPMFFLSLNVCVFQQ